MKVFYILIIIVYIVYVRHTILNSLTLTNPLFDMAYAKQIEYGKQKASRSRIVICFIAQNISHVFEKNKRRLEYIGNHFSEYKIIIFENDSIDNSRDLFKSWVVTNPLNVTLLDCEDAKECKYNAKPAYSYGTIGRIQKMARYRESCLLEVKRRFAHYDYVMVFDFDLDGSMNINGMFHSLSKPNTEWAGIGCYGMHWEIPGMIYDTGAYRNIKERFDKTPSLKLNSPVLNRIEAIQCLYSCLQTPMYEVSSSFGGCIIYQTEKILSTCCSYVSEHYNSLGECEHITFNRGLNKDRSMHIFINYYWYGRFSNPSKRNISV
jgi:hypothetical protein